MKTAVQSLISTIKSIDLRGALLSRIEEARDLLKQRISAESTRRFAEFETTVRRSLHVGDVVSLTSSHTVRYASTNAEDVLTKVLTIAHIYRRGASENQLAEGRYKGYKERPYIWVSDIKQIYRRGKLVLDVPKLRRSLGL